MPITDTLKALPLNSDPKSYNPGQERCPLCNQWHLRPGYCQAVSRETKRETETGDETETSLMPAWEREGVSKATWYRRKRAGAPST